MATFLARFAAAAAPVQPMPDARGEPTDIDARALQARLTVELGDDQPSTDDDLLALYGRYREARKEMHKVLAGRVDSEAEADLVVKRCDAILREIAKMPAATLRGFGAKMDVLRSCECAALEKVCPQNADEILLQSIVADSYRLLGAGETLLSEQE